LQVILGDDKNGKQGKELATIDFRYFSGTEK
jgi:hypothetical protein